MSAKALFVALALTLLPALALAAAPVANDALLASCTSCHGSQGEGNATAGGPPLAGQRSEYLARQLRAFRAGLRGSHVDDKPGAVMRSNALGLSDEAIALVALHFGQLPAAVPPNADGGDLAQGKAIYEGTCAVCHGPRAEGYAQLQSPNLQILGADYLTRQMHAYVQGWRGSSAQSEQAAVWMQTIANQLIDPAALASVAAYIQSLAKR